MKHCWIILIGLMLGWMPMAMAGTTEAPSKTAERLEYDLYFNWKFVWVKAGTAEFTNSSITHHGQPALRSFLRTKGSKKADAFFVMRDTLESVMSEKMAPFYFCKRAEEGKKYTKDEIFFTYADGKVTVNQSRWKKNKEPRHSETVENRKVYDMLSLLAHARTLSASGMKKGDKLHFPMATGVKVEDQTLIFRGTERFKTDDGTIYRCLVFSLVEYKDNNKKKEKEVITFYVTDDDNHLPVRLDLYLNFGSAKAFLTKIEGNKYPLTSIEGKK
jgi:hypothetical protein